MNIDDFPSAMQVREIAERGWHGSVMEFLMDSVLESAILGCDRASVTFQHPVVAKASYERILRQKGYYVDTDTGPNTISVRWSME